MTDFRTRKLIRTVKSKPLEDAPNFTTSEVIARIKKAKASKAFGPDGMSSLHLKHLGPRGIQFLTTIFNASLRYCQIPAIWKTSYVIPLPKGGKDPNLAASYRPVSLLCPAVKILEALLLPSIVEHLPPVSHQHGFRPRHSTTSALLKLTTDIASGFNQKKPASRTVVVALDLTKAFDSVDHRTLIELVSNSTLPSATTRWLSCYLRGRQAKTIFRDTMSTARIVRTGVPQGSVISPSLFNAYIRDLPTPPEGVNIVSYADDITVYASGSNIVQCTALINEYLKILAEFLDDRLLKVSVAKSTVTLFTPDNSQARSHPQVKLNGNVLPLEKRPKLLGVVFDTKFTFAEHANTTTAKVRRRNNIIRALAGTG